MERLDNGVLVCKLVRIIEEQICANQSEETGTTTINTAAAANHTNTANTPLAIDAVITDVNPSGVQQNNRQPEQNGSQYVTKVSSFVWLLLFNVSPLCTRLIFRFIQASQR